MTSGKSDADRPLPPHVTAAQFDRALEYFRGGRGPAVGGGGAGGAAAGQRDLPPALVRGLSS
jgi:hypothetical protein